LMERERACERNFSSIVCLAERLTRLNVLLITIFFFKFLKKIFWRRRI
jgi:hypothetical protein